MVRNVSLSKSWSLISVLKSPRGKAPSLNPILQLWLYVLRDYGDYQCREIMWNLPFLNSENQ